MRAPANIRTSRGWAWNRLNRCSDSPDDCASGRIDPTFTTNGGANFAALDRAAALSESSRQTESLPMREVGAFEAKNKLG